MAFAELTRRALGSGSLGLAGSSTHLIDHMNARPATDHDWWARRSTRPTPSYMQIIDARPPIQDK